MGNNLSDNQISELREIFKVEAQRYIKTIAKILLPLTESGLDADNIIELLGQAYVAAHGLRGSSGTVGLVRVSRLAEILENALKVKTQAKEDISEHHVFRFGSFLPEQTRMHDERPQTSGAPVPYTRANASARRLLDVTEVTQLPFDDL